MRGVSNQVRIIGGRWRGRKLAFPDIRGLRPTSDRVRETLFNWLAPVLPGAECLDLFAGSGALGFEAASRGATHVVMVERDPRVVRALSAARQRLATDGVEVVSGSAQDWLATDRRRFDVVFLDPPFAAAGQLAEVVSLLCDGSHLRSGALVYIETPAGAESPAVPPGWQLHREKRAGAVMFRLYRPGLAGCTVAEPEGNGSS
jgi:16S rRNA (guanine966-N2)-methyltransferase